VLLPSIGTLISTGVSGGSFSFVDVDKLLELEAGISTNEPGFIALTKAIEKAVHTLIIEGADLDLWAFKDEKAARPLINAHRVALGRDPLPEPKQRQIAQKVNTKVEVPKTAVDAPKQLAPKKPGAARLPVKSATNTPTSPAPKSTVKTSTSIAKSAGVGEKVASHARNSRQSVSKIDTNNPTKRALPVAQRSQRDPVPVDEETENSTTTSEVVVTKVSP